MSRSAKLLLFATVLAVFVAGCARPPSPTRMEVPSAALVDARTSAYANSVKVVQVTGGQDTNPLWTSELGPVEFRAALINSLRSAGLLHTGKGEAVGLEVQILAVKQPMLGASFTVTSWIRYTVRELGTGKSIFDQGIEATYTAKWNDAFLGVERLRLATEGAARENIRQFISAFAVDQRE